MNLPDLNYLELEFENKIIGGGISTYSYTDSTYSATSASTTPNGDISTLGLASAVSGATGTKTSAFTLTNALTSNNSFTYASAHASAGSTASTNNNVASSYSNAHSTSVGNSLGNQTIEYGSSLSFS